MITTLGYEELKRLHEERVAHSLRHHREVTSAAEAAAAAKAHANHIEPCLVIELPERTPSEHKIGA